MYITSLNYKNVGPLGDININFRKDDHGVPVPLVIVGKNGSGKSILLSNIIDSFYEIASKAYMNAAVGSEINHTYYKIISPIEIKIGTSYMVSHICFEHKNNKFEYIFKSGDIQFFKYNQMRGNIINNALNWMNEANFKKVNIQDKKIIKEIFEHDVVCFFGPNRYIRPVWMGKEYDTFSEATLYSVNKKYDNILKNPITAQNLPDITLQWLFDIISDSRIDISYISLKEDLKLMLQDTSLLNISRRHAERIMSEILCDEIFFFNA